MKNQDDNRKKRQANQQEIVDSSPAIASGRLALLVGTLADLLADLDCGYPGLRFRIINEQDRIREHIKIFINREQAFDLAPSLGPEDEVSILCALSGG
jgi:molybdopterin synthase sulfur carrier subunit